MIVRVKIGGVEQESERICTFGLRIYTTDFQSLNQITSSHIHLLNDLSPIPRAYRHWLYQALL